jgi:apolipoprotein N-acyltransferase
MNVGPVCVRGLLLAGLIASLWVYGQWSIRKTTAEDDHFPAMPVAAVQGSIPQDRKWEPEYQEVTLDIYERLSAQALKEQAGTGRGPVAGGGLVVWPETATPFYFQLSGPLAHRVCATARQLKSVLLFGSPSYRNGESGRREHFNSAYMISPDGVVSGRYDKVHLVPFGEYLPWGRLTSWARGLLPSAGDFSSGTGSSPLSWQDLRVGVLICFESIFPSLGRETVLKGANLLAVITNDAWFGRTGAPYQHEAMAVFRAVETRRWVVRAANTGVSSVITPWGERVETTSLFEPGFAGAVLRLRSGTTFFVRYGEHWFLGVCLLAIICRAFGLGLRPSRT